MSRSNGNNGQSGPPPRAAPPQWQQPGQHPADHDPHQLGIGGHHPGYGAPQQPGGQPQGGHGNLQTPQWTPYQPPAPPGQHTQPPAQRPQQPGQFHFPPADGYTQPPRTAPVHPQAQQPAPRNTLASYVPHGDRGAPPQDGRNYDLAQYGQGGQVAPGQPGWDGRRGGGADPYAQQPDPGYQQGYQQGYTAPQHAQPQWTPPADAYGQPQQGGYPAQGQPYALDAQGYPLQQPHQDPHGQYPSHGQHDPHGQFAGQQPQYEGEYDQGAPYEDEPKKKGRGLLVVAALVSAIVAGGGMAYLYKTFGGTGGGKAPILKAEQAPPKSRPATPGGKEFPHAERKITERLGDAPAPSDAATAASAASSEPGGPRRVQIIPITPGGGPSATGAAPPEISPARPTIAVPGMVVDNSQFGGPRPAPPVVQPPAQRQAAAPRAPAAQPKAAATQPPAAAAASAAPAEAQPTKRAAVAVPRTPKAADAFQPPAGATVAAAPAAGANGFVAVLSSQKSRMDALKVFADLQQRYGEVLSNKPADVQEANLGERGVFYRAVVGPPGSRESAAQLCSQLKSAGFTGCWVTAY